MFGLDAADLTGDFLIDSLLAAVAGVVLGLFYYGGLWWTVRQLQVTSRPGLLFAASFLIRTLVVVAGFVAVASGDWMLVVICLVFFIAVRMVLTRRLGPEAKGEGSGEVG